MSGSWAELAPEWFVMWLAFARKHQVSDNWPSGSDYQTSHITVRQPLDWVEQLNFRVEQVRKESIAPLAVRCAAWGAVPSGISEAARTRRQLECQAMDTEQLFNPSDVHQIIARCRGYPGNPAWDGNPPTYNSYNQWKVKYDQKQRADMLDAGGHREWLLGTSEEDVKKGVDAVLLAYVEREHAKSAASAADLGPARPERLEARLAHIEASIDTASRLNMEQVDIRLKALADRIEERLANRIEERLADRIEERLANRIEERLEMHCAQDGVSEVFDAKSTCRCM